MPAVRHQEREFVGMLEYRGEDEPLLLRNLIIGWRPIPLSSHINQRVHLFFLEFFRLETASGIDSHSRSSRLHPLHVHSSHWLHERWPQGAVTPGQYHLQHQEGSEEATGRRWGDHTLAGEHLPSAPQPKTIQRREGLISDQFTPYLSSHFLSLTRYLFSGIPGWEHSQAERALSPQLRLVRVPTNLERSRGLDVPRSH